MSGIFFVFVNTEYYLNNFKNNNRIMQKGNIGVTTENTNKAKQSKTKHN